MKELDDGTMIRINVRNDNVEAQCQSNKKRE